ncbi:MAG: lipoprotein-releasing system ATP-binding protein LolD [Acidobacteria bacterium]|jgi:lipoprotein-releasing system ATP-binding protein|nr:lipoprotein-releasing system ATP-binding protein LolD [Acidobacteriota bacterium]
MIEVQGVAKSYPSGDGMLQVLSAVDLSIDSGERVAVFGASGVGKSTFLHLLGGLDCPDTGSISFRGQRLDDMDEPALAQYRNHEVGFVFQFFQLLPEFTALENVMMPLLIAREHSSDTRERATELLHQVGVKARSHHFPSQLSGGERQRVAIARALVSRPSLVLADEPTGNLDVDTGLRVMKVFEDVQQQCGAAILMATHNAALVERFDKVLEMQPGGSLRPCSPIPRKPVGVQPRSYE